MHSSQSSTASIRAVGGDDAVVEAVVAVHDRRRALLGNVGRQLIVDLVDVGQAVRRRVTSRAAW